MEINQCILNDFMCIKEKNYDEAIVESKIIKLEVDLRLMMSKKEKVIFNQLLESYHKLQYLENLRLVDYVIKKTN